MCGASKISGRSSFLHAYIQCFFSRNIGAGIHREVVRVSGTLFNKEEEEVLVLCTLEYPLGGKHCLHYKLRVEHAEYLFPKKTYEGKPQKIMSKEEEKAFPVIRCPIKTHNKPTVSQPLHSSSETTSPCHFQSSFESEVGTFHSVSNKSVPSHCWGW